MLRAFTMSRISTGAWKRRFAVSFTALLSVLVTLGCQHQKKQQVQDLPNVLLISLDACRADRLSCYGHENETSPFLDELAKQGVRYSNAFVNTHGTPPSHTTILSSLYQETHRVQFNDFPRRDARRFLIPSNVTLLQELLRKEGYVTIGVTAGGYMSGNLGFARGFDVFQEDVKGIESCARILENYIRKHAPNDRPIFALFHTYEIHSPYNPPHGYREIFGTYQSDFEPSSENLLLVNAGKLEVNDQDVQLINSMYDAGIRYTDDTLRKLFRSLTSLRFFDNCLVIITSDHGEELGERGRFVHGDQLYDSLIHVPLIVTGTSVPQGTVDNRLVSTIDIAPTVLEYAGLPVPTDMEGRNFLIPKKNGSTDDEDAVFSQYEGHRYSIRTASWKLIRNLDVGTTELYDLRNDPQETQNVIAAFPERRAQLESRLLNWKQNRKRLPHIAPAVTFDEEDLERLRSLGYAQ